MQRLAYDHSWKLGLVLVLLKVGLGSWIAMNSARDVTDGLRLGCSLAHWRCLLYGAWLCDVFEQIHLFNGAQS